MVIALSEIERRLLAEIQHGMPASSTPYRDVAEKIGVDIDDVLEILNSWKKDGRMRRVGAIVNHFKVGLQAGAMVVWQVEEDRIEEVGKMMASFPEVSHAYERPSNDQWPFNVYTMVHGPGAEDVRDTIKKMSAKVGIKNYKQLETIRELKKVPPTYILTGDK
ncbi:MAG: Lrp/AsnC family transcriptional regulator [Planctomycetes bacterium]|nr:Lrp/AsnC family transcriptional regulator [Planctomycetota bacterium]